MKPLSLLSFVLTLALAPSSMMNAHSVSTVKVTIAAEHGSKQHGSAMLVQKGANVVVTLTMSGIPAGVSEPAHIHPGTCAKLNPAPKYALANAKNGATTTTLKHVMLATLLGGKFAINVHDAKNLKIYVACGPIK